MASGGEDEPFERLTPEEIEMLGASRGFIVVVYDGRFGEEFLLKIKTDGAEQPSHQEGSPSPNDGSPQRTGDAPIVDANEAVVTMPAVQSISSEQEGPGAPGNPEVQSQFSGQAGDQRSASYGTSDARTSAGAQRSNVSHDTFNRGFEMVSSARLTTGRPAVSAETQNYSVGQNNVLRQVENTRGMNNPRFHSVPPRPTNSPNPRQNSPHALPRSTRPTLPGPGQNRPRSSLGYVRTAVAGPDLRQSNPYLSAQRAYDYSPRPTLAASAAPGPQSSRWLLRPPRAGLLYPNQPSVPNPMDSMSAGPRPTNQRAWLGPSGLVSSGTRSASPRALMRPAQTMSAGPRLNSLLRGSTGPMHMHSADPRRVLLGPDYPVSLVNMSAVAPQSPLWTISGVQLQQDVPAPGNIFFQGARANAVGFNQPLHPAADVGQFFNYASNVSQHPYFVVGVNQPSNYATGVNQPSNYAIGVNQPPNYAIGVNQPSNYVVVSQPPNYAIGVNQPSNYVVDVSQSSHYVVDVNQSSHYVTDGNQSSHYVADVNQSSHYVIDGNQSSHYVIDGNQSSHYVVDVNQSSHYASGVIQPSNYAVEVGQPSHQYPALVHRPPLTSRTVANQSAGAIPLPPTSMPSLTVGPLPGAQHSEDRDSSSDDGSLPADSRDIRQVNRVTNQMILQLKREGYALRRVRRVKQCFRSKQELKALRRVKSCSFACSIQISYELNKKLYMVLDYHHAGTLQDMLEKHYTLPEPVRINAFVDMANAFHYLKKAKIMHRKVSPKSWKIDKEGHLTLCDFHVAHCFKMDAPETSQRCRLFYGAWGYIAPEIYQRGEYNYRADWFSMGVICLEMEGIYNKANFEPYNRRNCELDFIFSQQALDSIENTDPDKRPDPDNIPDIFDALRGCLWKTCASKIGVVSHMKTQTRILNVTHQVEVPTQDQTQIFDWRVWWLILLTVVLIVAVMMMFANFIFLS